MRDSCSLAVCMPVFNAEPFIEQTSRQILSQTFSDFTFIVTDDGSTDNTFDIIKKINDPRILLFRNTRNLGAVPTRNSMLDYCIEHGFEYMALMDADDLVHSQRLEKQLKILSNDPSLAVCGSSMKIERTGRIWHAPIGPAEVKALCVFANPIPTPTAMIKLQYMKTYNLKWRREYAPCADYYLWYQMLFEHNLRGTNTGDVDMVYSHSPAGVSHREGLEAQEEKDVEVKRCILRHFNLDLSNSELHGFMKIALYRSKSAADAPSFLDVSTKLIEANRNMIVSDDVMRRMISHRAFVYLVKCRTLNPEIKGEIRSRLVLPLSALLAEVEVKLKEFKHNILGRSFLMLSYYLEFICKGLREMWMQIRRKAT